MIHTLRVPKWNDVLLEIYVSQEKNRYVERLHKSVNTSLSHLRNIVRQLEKYRLIEIHHSSKTKNISLTPKGEQIAQQIMQVRTALSRL